MKKILLTFSAIALLTLPSVKAQYINPDFETWSHTAGPPAYDDPNTSITTNGWQELNFASNSLAGSSRVSVYKESIDSTVTPYHGSYCARIETVALSATTDALVGTLLPNDTLGVIFTGTVNPISQKIATKIPFNLPVQNYYFYYQYYPVGNDTAFCLVTYTRNDTVIAVGKTTIQTLTNSWSLGQVTPFVMKGGAPDSIAIWFSSSSWHKPHQGSNFYIDDATSTGMPSIFGNNDFISAYPNPAKNEINIKVTGTLMASTAEVYDITGKTIATFNVRNNFLTINTQSYNSGIYFYKMFDNTGTQLNVGKFSVIK